MDKRLNIALPERSVERLQRLQALTGAATASEVIRRAVVTYEGIAEHLNSGATFYMTTRDGETVGVDFLIDVPGRRPPFMVITGGKE